MSNMIDPIIAALAACVAVELVAVLILFEGQLRMIRLLRVIVRIIDAREEGE